MSVTEKLLFISMFPIVVAFIYFLVRVSVAGPKQSRNRHLRGLGLSSFTGIGLYGIDVALFGARASEPSPILGWLLVAGGLLGAAGTCFMQRDALLEMARTVTWSPVHGSEFDSERDKWIDRKLAEHDPKPASQKHDASR